MARELEVVNGQVRDPSAPCTRCGLREPHHRVGDERLCDPCWEESRFEGGEQDASGEQE